MEEILKKKILDLNIDKESKTILANNKIETVYDLCACSRMELSEIGLSNIQINKVMVILQLFGLDLKQNHSKTNSILEQYLKKK